MRREFVQVIAVLALSLGAGLFAVGHYLDPPIRVANPALLHQLANPDMEVRGGAAAARGVGVALITLGGLSLVLPWINEWCARRRQAPESRSVAE